MSASDNEEDSGFFDRLKGAAKEALFKDPDEGRPTQRKSAPSAPSASPAPMPISVPLTAPVGTAAADPRIRLLLQQAVDKVAPPAYSALLQLMKAMQSALPDENARLGAALAALSAQNQDAVAVLKDVDECLRALDQKEAEAAQAAEESRASTVGGLEQQLRSATDGIARKQAEIARLQQEITADQVTATRLQQEVSGASAKIDSTLASIKQTAAIMRQELVDVRTRIKGKVGG